MATEHVLASWHQAGTQLQHPKPALLPEMSSRYLGASFCGQVEPRNVPVGKAHCLCADIPVVAVSSPVSSHHLCFKLCSALAPMECSWQWPVEK